MRASVSPVAVETELPRHPALAWVVAASALLAAPLAWVAVTTFGLRLNSEVGPHLWIALTAAPLLEEWALRSLLQRGIEETLRRRRWPAWCAAWVAGAAAVAFFAGIHLDAWTWQALVRCSAWLVPGAALAAAWCHRRRWTDCVLLHAWFNATMWWVGSVAR